MKKEKYLKELMNIYDVSDVNELAIVLSNTLVKTYSHCVYLERLLDENNISHLRIENKRGAN